MRNHRSLNGVLNTDRKALYMLLSIVMISVLTLTVVYAALSTTLNINGNAEVSAASWDIYLSNPKVINGSATTNVPEIKTTNSLEFTTTLNVPGDFYEFTVDIVNAGTIDAMIENVVKTPELSVEQTKYLNYIITYQNGESIGIDQILTAGTSMPLKVRIEYKKDISASDLPSSQTVLNLALVLKYIQSDGTGNNVTNNDMALGFPIEWNSKNILGNHSIEVNNMFFNGVQLIKISDFAPSFEEVSNSQMTFCINYDGEYINETIPIIMDNTYQQNYLSYGTVTMFRYEHSIDAIGSLFFVSVSDINDTGNMVEEIGEIPFQESGLYVANNISGYPFEEFPSFDVIMDKIN